MLLLSLLLLLLLPLLLALAAAVHDPFPACHASPHTSSPTHATQIWELASGGAPALAQPQFNAAMRLVALAQVNMGRLPPDQARAVALGGGPQVPLPRMAGLDVPPPAPGAPGYTVQVTGAVPPAYLPQPTGSSAYGGAAPGYAAQLTGASAAYAPQLTGASYHPQVTGASAASSAAAAAAAAAAIAAQFPPVSAEDMSRYKAQFAHLDRDGDGLVQGGDCFGVFMQTGLDKRVLKVIWDVVAGASGALDAEQFVRCLYLMDRAKRGAPPPPALPPGPFPPLAPGVTMPAPRPGSAAGGGAAGAASAGPTGAGAPPPQPAAPAPAPQQWTLESQFGEKSAAKAVAEVYDQTLPRLPGLPPKVTYDDKGRPAAASRASEVPDLDGEVARCALHALSFWALVFTALAMVLFVFAISIRSNPTPPHIQHPLLPHTYTHKTHPTQTTACSAAPTRSASSRRAPTRSAARTRSSRPRPTPTPPRRACASSRRRSPR